MIPVTDPSEIPEFQTEEEEVAFWDTHEITETLWDALPVPDDLPSPRRDGDWHPFLPAIGGSCLTCTNLGRVGFRDDPIHEADETTDV